MTGAGAHPVVVFDGDCILCSANARFILRHDRRGHFRLATMQGAAGAALMARFGIDPLDPETFILVEGDRVRRNSDAALAIAEGLGWPWRALGALRIVPRPLRDAVYGLVARNRYRWFGRRERCFVPTPEQARRVLP
ncbi:thiol-disulfide oxidoreductase DCC family protein [Pelagerythrobacter sp.]|uniref:thiol-disulfide oxidoreductase DCC family protein n=1 Tax=Pelagerythrobacter sp. TaxID=2800702 RepID=UPI0035B369A1